MEPFLSAQPGIFRKILGKIVLIPKIKSLLERIFQFYADYHASRNEIWGMFEQGKEGWIIDIRESFSEHDAAALKGIVDKVLKENMIAVEIGSWKGMSTAILARKVKDYNGKVFAIDHWLGSEGVDQHGVARKTDIFSVFRRNISMLGLANVVKPLVMDSLAASAIFADSTVDIVFIDGDHRYAGFKKDIEAWWPKLKEGGIICGHDCEGYYMDYPEEVKRKIDVSLGDDYIPETCHPGVVKALYEYFDKDFEIMPDSVVWYLIKEGQLRRIGP